MANLPFYPGDLPGLAFSVVRRPKWSTEVQPHVSGREVRLGYWTYPLYEWDLTYSVLRDFLPCPGYSIPSELKRLEGFFLAMQGSLLPFYFLDPDDNTVLGQPIGTGDGTTTQFLLIRTWGDPSYGATVTEPVGNVSIAGLTVYLNGIPLTRFTDYNIANLYPDQPSFWVRFASAPAAGVIITADLVGYSFYVRFKDDTLDFAKFSGAPGAGFWEVKKLTLVSLRPLSLAAPP